MLVKTPEAAHCHLKVASLNTNCFTVKQGVSYFLPG